MNENNAVQEETKIDPQVNQKPQEVQQESVEEVNWRKFRQQREEERKQREAAEKYARQKEEEAAALKQAMQALVEKPEKEIPDETEDQRIERKVEEKLRLKELEFEKQRAEREIKELPNRLIQTHRDFNDICTTENLDYLEYHFPEIAQAYKHMPDGFEKWDGLYKAVKRFIPNKDSKKDVKKAENNLAKPLAISKPGATQTGDHAPVLQLDEARKRSNWERMRKVMGQGGIG